MRDAYDFIVVGGGPVGLHAALKAAVLRHSVLVVDKGARFSRVSQAARIANIPLSPGISGLELIARLRKDLEALADLSGERLVDVLDGTEAVDARREGETFVLRLREVDGGVEEREVRSRALVLATGLVDRKPHMDRFHERGHSTLAPYVHRGEIGYCILCEGWDLASRDVGVVGSSEDAVQIALDVQQHYGGNVTLLTDAEMLERKELEGDLARAGVRVEERAIASYADDAGRVRIALRDGDELELDKVFFSLGFYRVNNELAVKLGAATTAKGYVRTDDNSEVVDPQGNVVPGLFAVGDLRAERWKQIVVGWGDAETAVITAYAKRIPW